mmetsp:Transcript_93348/g.302058  ORF Transcript_93348/g.302058 Transcript_93348/m.302058 type:complete len:339 (+) Transcript_93348:700-1716(+)
MGAVHPEAQPRHHVLECGSPEHARGSKDDALGAAARRGAACGEEGPLRGVLGVLPRPIPHRQQQAAGLGCEGGGAAQVRHDVGSAERPSVEDRDACARQPATHRAAGPGEGLRQRRAVGHGLQVRLAAPASEGTARTGRGRRRRQARHRGAAAAHPEPAPLPASLRPEWQGPHTDELHDRALQGPHCGRAEDGGQGVVGAGQDDTGDASCRGGGLVRQCVAHGCRHCQVSAEVEQRVDFRDAAKSGHRAVCAGFEADDHLHHLVAQGLPGSAYLEPEQDSNRAPAAVGACTGHRCPPQARDREPVRDGAHSRQPHERVPCPALAKQILAIIGPLVECV